MSRAPKALFPIAIEPGSLSDYPSDRDIATHRGIGEVLLECGILALEVDQGAQLIDEICKLESGVGEFWNKLIRGLDTMNRVDRTLLSAFISELLDGLEGTGDAADQDLVLVASEDSANKHGVDHLTPFREFGAIDLVVAAAVKLAPRAILAASLKSFAAGTSREEIADSLLAPLSERSGTATVFDPYLFHHVLGASKGSRDHFQWLVKIFAERLPPGATLRFVGDVPRPGGPAEPLNEDWIKSTIEAAIAEVASLRDRPLTIEITLGKGTLCGKKAHNRYLDFDCGFTFDVTPDFIRLGSDTTQGPDALNFNRFDEAPTTHARRVIADYVNHEHKSELVQWEFSLPRPNQPK